MLDTHELHTVEQDEHMLVCARRRRKNKQRNVRIGTYARVPLGSILSRKQKEALVHESVMSGRVLSIEESQRILLASALEGW